MVTSISTTLGRAPTAKVARLPAVVSFTDDLKTRDSFSSRRPETLAENIMLSSASSTLTGTIVAPMIRFNLATCMRRSKIQRLLIRKQRRSFHNATK